MEEQERLPLLAPEAPQLAPTFFTVVNKPSVPATYIRVPIRNTSKGTATRCSAKLLKIEFIGKDGWRALPYVDALDMAWANKAPGTKEIDLGPDGVDILEVAYTVDGSREMRIASIVPANYPGLMSLPGDYRFTFQLASSNAGSRTVKLRVQWNFDRPLFPSDPIEID
jgi:hypothetical protein